MLSFTFLHIILRKVDVLGFRQATRCSFSEVELGLIETAVLRRLWVVVDDSIGGCNVDLLLSPHYILTALSTA